jgi:hypothetical protein
MDIGPFNSEELMCWTTGKFSLQSYGTVVLHLCERIAFEADMQQCRYVHLFRAMLFSFIEMYLAKISSFTLCPSCELPWY